MNLPFSWHSLAFSGILLAFSSILWHCVGSELCASVMWHRFLLLIDATAGGKAGKHGSEGDSDNEPCFPHSIYRKRGRRKIVEDDDDDDGRQFCLFTYVGP
jgi:hypothetical protein